MLIVHTIDHFVMLCGAEDQIVKNFEEANEILRQFWPEKLVRRAYTSEYMLQFMDFLGNPQDKLKVIHVAGTSGKTSTSYYCAALLKAAGKSVGLTVSPHVDEINERVQVDLQPLNEAEYCRELDIFLDVVKKSKLTLTYFEVLISFAYWEFVRRGVEYAVIEVGMGGNADATNVVNRPDKVCVITDIGLDHINVLGSTLGEIAESKAGIIRLHNSAFCYHQPDEALDKIKDRAKQKQADLHILAPEATQSQLIDLPLFQQRNLGLARAAVDHALAQNGQPILTEKMVATAAQTYIPARMETIKRSGKTIIMDGAHNYQKLHALGDSLKQKYPGQSIAAVVGFVGQRAYRLEDSAKELSAFVDHIIVTSFHGSQDERHDSEDPQEVLEILEHNGAKSLEVVANSKNALDVLLARPEPILLVAGSFYMLNDIRPLLDLHGKQKHQS